MTKTNDQWDFVKTVLDCAAIRTVYLWGPPGIGKTYSAYNGGRAASGLYSITLTEDTPASELRGQWIPQGGEFTWHDGPFTAAMRHGFRLVVNEVSHASDDVLALLYPVLESMATARMTLPTGETVEPKPSFHVIVTDNEAPEQLPEALQDRFDATIHVDKPHPDAIKQLSKPLRLAAERTCSLGDDRAISLRSWFKLDELHPILGMETACRAVFGENRMIHVLDALRIAGERTE